MDIPNKPVLPKFALGQIVATPGALSALAESREMAIKFLSRHIAGDWGDVDAEDWKLNDAALTVGERLLSAYVTASGAKLWIITEADRSVTTLLLPDEY